MSTNDTHDANMDRLLTDWLVADAAPRAPESLETAFVEGVASTRQRPAWATTERWISMDTRAQLGVMPRALIFILTISVLIAALAASLALAGSFADADDGGDVTAGLTYATSEGVIHIHPTDGTGDPVPLTPGDEFALNFAWSLDGARFSYESWTARRGPITLMIRDADGSNPVVASEPFDPAPKGGKPTSYAWSPDDSRVIYWAHDIGTADEWPRCTQTGMSCGQRIWSAPTDGSEPARVIGDPELDARAPAWTPDGTSIVFAGSPGGGTDWGIYRMDPDGANVERIGDLISSGFAFDQIAISPDGSTAAVSVGPNRQDIYLVDLATGEEVLIAGEEADEYEPFWSPDGSLIAFTSWSTEPRAMLYDLASGEIISLDISLIVLGWSPDSRSILGHWPDGVLTVVDVTDPTAPVATEVEDVTGAEWPSWRPLS